MAVLEIAGLTKVFGSGRLEVRALANRPKLILADEPTASLDTARGKKVMEMLKKIARENQTTVIAVTHDSRMIEGFDQIYHLKDGRLNNAPEYS